MKNLDAYNEYRIVHPFFPEEIGDEHNGFFFMNILGRNFYIGANAYTYGAAKKYVTSQRSGSFELLLYRNQKQRVLYGRDSKTEQQA